jgi:hypothetical protein
LCTLLERSSAYRAPTCISHRHCDIAHSSRRWPTGVFCQALCDLSTRAGQKTPGEKIVVRRSKSCPKSYYLRCANTSSQLGI